MADETTNPYELPMAADCGEAVKRPLLLISKHVERLDLLRRDLRPGRRVCLFLLDDHQSLLSADEAGRIRRDHGGRPFHRIPPIPR